MVDSLERISVAEEWQIYKPQLFSTDFFFHYLTIWFQVEKKSLTCSLHLPIIFCRQQFPIPGTIWCPSNLEAPWGCFPFLHVVSWFLPCIDSFPVRSVCLSLPDRVTNLDLFFQAEHSIRQIREKGKYQRAVRNSGKMRRTSKFKSTFDSSFYSLLKWFWWYKIGS